MKTSEITMKSGLLSFALVFLSACEGGMEGTGTGTVGYEIRPANDGPSQPGPVTDDPPSLENCAPTPSNLVAYNRNTPFSPPVWAQGNWGNGDVLIVISNMDIAIGNTTSQSSAQHERDFEVTAITSTEREYNYTISYTNEDDDTVTASHRFINNNDGVSLTYQSADISTTLNRLSARELIMPPTWLQKIWSSHCDLRVISENDIEVHYFSDTTRLKLSESLDSITATLQVRSVSDNLYDITYTFPNDEGDVVMFHEKYNLIDNLEMNYTWAR